MKDFNDILFCRFSQIQTTEAYIIDRDTLVDLLDAVAASLTYTQKQRINVIQEVLNKEAQDG